MIKIRYSILQKLSNRQQKKKSKDTPDIKINILPIRCIPNNYPQEGLSVLFPVITQVADVSLSSREFSRIFSHALVKPLLKKSKADCEILNKKWRPVSNLSFLSKFLEKVVALRLSTYISQISSHDKMYSSYKAAHGTAFALIAV